MNQVVSTDRAPAAIGPYSQAIKLSNLLFTSGQLPINPATGDLVEGGIEEQTRQVLDNLKAVIEAGGSSLSSVVKTTVYMTNLAEFGAMNAVYAAYFPENPPARSTAEIKGLAKNALVEIEAVVAL